MNKRFFNQQNLTRRLRMLPVLFAMLLMPLSAWADSYFGINTTSGSYWVSDDTAADVLGNGSHKITYDVTNNILTLNDIDLEFISSVSYDAFIAMVDTDHPTLTVRLVGDNTLTIGDKACVFNGWGITFTTDASNPGTLTINTGDNWGGALFVYNPDPTSTSLNATYNNGLSLSQNGNTYTIQAPSVSYNITVAGTAVTSANASNVLNDDYSSVSYNASTNTLTLKGVHLNSTNNGISVSSDLNINLVGYSNVGTINVTSGTLNFTTSTTLPGCLITNITGNSTITYGDGTGLSWDGSMVKSSSTNPYIIYATGCKMDGDNYCISGGDFSVKDNKGEGAALDVSTDGTVANSLNNASIDYYKVSSDSKSCYIYPASLDDMNLVTKAYLLFDWGTCTNKDVKVQVRGMNSNYENDGTYSEEVSLPADGGLVEIPLTGTVNSYYFQIYFSSSTGEFSFIPISVGFQKTESYGLTVGGVEVTPDNASSITGTNITGTVSYNALTNTLTLNGATINGIITYSGTEDLTIAFSGTNAVSTSENYAIQYVGSDSELPNLAFSLTNGSTTGSLNLSSENCVINGFSDVDFGNLNLASASAQGVYYDSSEYGYHMAGYGGNPNNLTITTETYHPIWIYDPSLGQEASHTQLNSNKLSVAFGEGTISFDGNHTITMNNVDFNYEDNTLIVVGPGMEELTVNLVGTSTVRSGSIFLSLWATTPLTFTTDESNPGSLTAPTIVSWNNFENGQITYQNGLVFNFDESTYKGTISTTGDRLKIGDISINATGDITGDGITGTVHFDTSNNTLTLTGATIGDATAENNIQVFVDNLKVSINGSNTIFGNIIYEGNNLQSSAVQINKASDASTASLTASGISGFANCSWSEGIYLSAVNGAGIPTDIHYESYENEGGSMVSYSGDFSTITFSTTKPSESIWIGETQVGTNGTFSGIGGVSFDSDKNILTLDNADLQSQGNIISSLPNLTIKLTGEDGERYGRSDLGENKYIISTDPSATLTFTTDGNNSLCSTIDNYDFPWKGFAGNPTFENKLVLLQAAGTMSIEVLQAPTMSYASGNLSFDGLSDGYGNEFDCYYSITYADGDGNIETTKYEPGDGDQPNPVSMVEKPCTVTAYVTYKDRLGNTTQSETAIGKYFGPAEDPMRLVYGADPVDFVLAPTIEENDGIKINGIEANVTYNATTGKVSSSTLGSHGAVVSLGYQDETIQTTLLNNYFSMSFDVVPPAPTIGLAEGDYPSTQENITITSDGLANTTIKYQWDEGEIKDYPATGGVPFQAGTLKAWVVYTNGGTSLSSDIVSATYTLLQDPGLDFVVGDNPVEEDVNYTIGGSSNPTLPTLQKPEGVTVTYASSNTGVATVATDGTVTPVGVGYTTITATSTATSEYEAGEASYTLNVYKDLSHSSITVEVANVTYNGQAKTPTVTVKDGDKVLMYGEDNGGGTLLYEYKVEYANNTNAGLATAETGAPTVTVTAYTDDDYLESHMEVTHYRGSTTKTFTINKAQLTVTPDDKTYNVGDDITLTVSYEGFVNGETETVLTTQPSASYGTADVTKPGSYEITASGGVAQNYDFIYETGTLTINRQLNVSFSETNEWATYYGTESLAIPTGLKAYQVTAVEGATVTISEIGYIPANTAVLLQNVSNNNTWSNIPASAYTGATSTFASNKLIGTASDVDVSTISGGTVYVLYNNMFKRATGGTIPANRGYLVVEPSAVNAGNAPQLSITIGDENTTAISNTDFTDNTDKANEWYSIDGVKLNGQPQKPGLYIKNGKKVFINKK